MIQTTVCLSTRTDAQSSDRAKITYTDDVTKHSLTTVFGTDVVAISDDTGGRVKMAYEAHDRGCNYAVGWPESDICIDINDSNLKPTVKDALMNVSNGAQYQTIDVALSRLVTVPTNNVICGSYVTNDPDDGACEVGYYGTEFHTNVTSETLLANARLTDRTLHALSEQVSSQTPDDYSIEGAVFDVVDIALTPLFYGIRNRRLLSTIRGAIAHAAMSSIDNCLADDLPWEE